MILHFGPFSLVEGKKYMENYVWIQYQKYAKFQY